ncbi:MAG: translation initiation factor IF-3 [Phycisphaerae bacterium]|nr:translation initiation factor IF-3 [Phycisphaerae bacterium]
MSQNIRLRVNEQIRISPVRLIDHEKNMIGVVPTDEALRMARDAGLDLVEMSPNERPPVCKIMDYGKHKYQLSKKSKQKHHEQKIKEVRLRPKTEEHDLEVKLKRARTFLEHGDRVLITMLFKGRERFHQDIAYQTFREIAQDFAELAKVDQPPRLLGKKMSMVLAPTKLPAPQKGGGTSKGTSPKRPSGDVPSKPSPRQEVRSESGDDDRKGEPATSEA